MDTAVLLNPITTPLNQVCLIEASAGTGKTYTIGSLYLRLLLQAGEDCFSRPLSVQEILVVTFTEAATEELKGRIRERIHQAKQAFIAYKTEGVRALAHDHFLVELMRSIQDIDAAIQRLKMAEQTMDLAAIYTIHGFCRRMLMQYAFNSGIHFNLELVKDESELLERLFNDFWREHFYSQPLDIANYIHQVLVSPQAVLKKLRSHISHQLELDISQKAWLTMSLVDFLQHRVLPKQQLVQQLKQQWLDNETELRSLILHELDKNYKKGEKKSLKRTNFKKNYVPKWFDNIQAWANSALSTRLPETLTKYFSQQALLHYAEEGAEPISHPVFQLVDEVIAHTTEQVVDQQVVLYHYLCGVQQKLLEHKLNHAQKNFDDLLRLLKQALYSVQGEELAQFIRLQYPFAMIDEFQDTDAQQYQIFAKIYIHSMPVENGFIMIGDPKQAIYKFRGADIFTYFKAAQQADAHFTLGTNWRSEQSLVKSINTLFHFQSGLPFVYPQIQFQPVSARNDQAKFILNGQIEPALRCYIGDLGESKNTRFSTTQKQKLAQICAISIQYWLQYAQENNAIFASEQATQPLMAERIAVLVRNWSEAELVAQALQQLGIASVYLSDRSNVFDCDEAKQLALILTACLNPFSERHILNAIATRIFALTACEMSAIKQDEQRWSELVERFVNYQHIWQKQGILVMLHQLFLDEKITEKLLASLGGERKATDLLHLAELLQGASRLNESAASLLRWFEKQIQGEDRQDGQQIRLESERQLVKIVTIHKSKGLEYDLVWLPFIADSLKENKQLIQTYYDSTAQRVLWDVEQQHQVEIEQEQRAEEMRLLYVAFTRAKYQIALALPESFLPSWNCLQYLFTQGQMDRREEVRSVLTEFQQCMMKQQVNVAIDDFTTLQPDVTSQVISPTETLHCAEFNGQIEQNWQVTSFTAISAQHERTKQFYLAQQQDEKALAITLLSELKDYSLEQNYSQDSYLQKAIVEGYAAGYTPFDLPAGAQIGQVLHQYFEQNVFNKPIELTMVHQLCQQLQLDQKWFVPLQTWLTHILTTPLLANENLKLADLAPQDCLKEMEFYLQLAQQFQSNKFNQLLQKYQVVSTPLQLQDLKQSITGMLRGFIDLVFRYQGKYYLLDYKSNKLGNTLADYAPEQLNKVMVEQHYDWQYLFYTVALHRYLTQRDPHYRYQTHFGGVIYTFLRGMNGKDNHGVYFNKPHVGLIEELEELL
ncbi:exodeoxyribonuclease V subunit beta [Pasteurella oralis]|uniref:exodeoxyribonuclease V subunit beta n=1 Tax=Pasteurella oralis TaxID=1071947 RepID=UPI000C7B8DA3|nr:exodeoxyribonuclease V subunit beta [Pasteurella oralis]